MQDEILILMERYENKIIWLEQRSNDENYSYYKGIQRGLEIAIHDLMDVLDDIEITSI